VFKKGAEYLLVDYFDLPSGHKLKLSTDAFQTMVPFIQKDPKSTEAGGIMVGRVLSESSNIVIDCVSCPMTSDVRRRNRYIRNPKGHQEFFNSKWEESGGRCYYLGEWHTHPEVSPNPSHVDLSTWKNLLRNPTQDLNMLFFIILGTYQMKLWRGININDLTQIDFISGFTINSGGDSLGQEPDE
jgi:integrative and conjugative element protein (TIGR02256 family)